MHKAGFVNIVGNPNVGKSTLMNQLVGERISIATFKAQTTRHRIMGIVNTDDMQIVFSDTPGVLKPNYKMQEMMLAFSESALADADVLLYVTDVIENPEKNMDSWKRLRKCRFLYSCSSTRLIRVIRRSWVILLKNGTLCCLMLRFFLSQRKINSERICS